MVLAGCSSGGEEPGPKVPAANSPEGKKAAEDAINSAPPELREQIRAQRDKSMNQAGPPPSAKK